MTSNGKMLQDVRVEEGKIVEIGSDLKVNDGEEVIDCTGKFILPGVIDVHVHLREPGGEHKEDFESGTKAASAGGVTMVLDMPNNSPAVISQKALEEKRALVNDKAQVDYDLYMGATFDPKTGKTNVGEFLKSDAVALKIYVGSSTGNLLVHQKEALEEIFEKVAEADRLICVHAEDEALIKEHMAQFEGEDDPIIHAQIRDDEVAYRAVKLVLHLAKKHGTRLHIAHLSTTKELREFEEFKSDRISCEVTPHHLFLNQLELREQGNFAKMNPPLRTEEDQAALMEGLRSGLVNMVATDHAPHTKEEKEKGYWEAPAGVPGLETMLPLLLDAVNHGELELEDVVRVTSEEPARVFELEIGLEKGKAANFTVVDMDLVQTVENGGSGARYTKCGWSPFAGHKLKGWPVMTVVKGEIVFGEAD